MRIEIVHNQYNLFYESTFDNEDSQGVFLIL